MFFPRLRRQAKWMFVFLALVFGLGYVIFNVGGTIPGTGIADLIRDAGTAASGQISVSEAEDRIRDNPNNPDGYRQLSQALQVEGRTGEAIAPLERYLRTRPKDSEALQELAALYSVETDRLRSEYQLAQYRVSIENSDSILAPRLRLTPGGQTLSRDPISEALATKATEEASVLGQELQAVSTKAVGTYRKIARLNPDDATAQSQLAQAAESAGDAATALAAYRRFLELAPDDSTAPLIKQRITQIEQASAAPR